MTRRPFDRLTIDGISPPMKRRRHARVWSPSETALGMLIIGVVCASIWALVWALIAVRWAVL